MDKKKLLLPASGPKRQDPRNRWREIRNIALACAPSYQAPKPRQEEPPRWAGISVRIKPRWACVADENPDRPFQEDPGAPLPDAGGIRNGSSPSLPLKEQIATTGFDVV
jgi:hypothetical protein